MSYSNGVYTYTSPSTLPSGVYKYTFTAVTNGSGYSWNQCSEENITIELKENTVDTHSYSWPSEPGYVASENYTFNLTIVTSGTPSSFGNIQFVDNNDNSSNYNWGQYISYNWSNMFEFSKANLDSSLPLYFKIYMWSDNSNIYVGDTGNANFLITPTGTDEINATLTFTYSNTSNIIGNLDVESQGSNTISHSNVTLSNVYATSTITPTYSGAHESFVASYTGENIRIDNNSTIVALKAGTQTAVTLTTLSGASCTFKVTVSSSWYTANYDTAYCGGSNAVSIREGWFTSTSVSEISSMSSSFMNGIDISSAKALYDNGAKFYNSDGVEQSLFYILKDAGVNWIRLKLWVDPYTNNGVSYGGGESDLDNTLWMAYEAKQAGLNVLLDFHYSDYWTHPGQQIIPKAWASAATPSALANYIRTYTTDTLNEFNDYGCLPEMVQLGNEISSGSFLQSPGADSDTFSDYKPSYLTNASDNATLRAYAGSSNMTTYLNAAINGVKAVSSSIKTVVHWAKGSDGSASAINNFFNSISSSYDYAALSYYPYYCFNNISEASSILNGISISKPWFIAETSYPFSGDGYAGSLCNFTVSNTSDKSSLTNIYKQYSFNGSGQANLIHDLTNTVVSAGGIGIFYWEGAWIPNANVGWAGSGSRNTWGNQGFFSFDGKAIANLDLFAQMSPHI